MDDNLLNLFLLEYPNETNELLQTGVPDGQTFLSALEALIKRNQDRSYIQDSQKDYDAAMVQDRMTFVVKPLMDTLRAHPLVLTPSDIKILRLKKLTQLRPEEEAEASRILEKAKYVDLYERLLASKDALQSDDFCTKARQYLDYVQK